MSDVVAVYDRFPLGRSGLCAVVEVAGRSHVAVTCEEQFTGAEITSALFAVRDPSDAGLARRLLQSASLAVLFLLTLPAGPLCADLVNLGAAGVLPADIDATSLLGAMSAVSAGLLVVPRTLRPRLGDSRDDSLVDEDRRLLRGLAAGVTVAQLARQHGCSERTMHRQLQRLYEDLNVENRAAAVTLALRSSLI